MIPSLNFNPSFANLAALHGLGGGMPHPIRPVAAMPWPMQGATAGLPMQAGSATATAPMPGMPMQPQGNLANLNALMQLFGRQQ